jgi:hypothetical protein
MHSCRYLRCETLDSELTLHKLAETCRTVHRTFRDTPGNGHHTVTRLHLRMAYTVGSALNDHLCPLPNTRRRLIKFITELKQQAFCGLGLRG